jgi:hypothetical protein
MFADRAIQLHALPLVVAALVFPFAPAVWAQTASCTAVNPNASVIQTTPTADFDATATDGTVIHTKTGLMWKRCAEGQTWDDTNATCAGTAGLLNWQNALAAAATSTFAGHSDWRLPNVKELQSIVESCGYNPAINQTVFPATPAAFSWWSASSYGPNPASAWSVNFNGGNVFANDRSIGLFVRLVRGGQSFDSFDFLLGVVTVSKTVAGAATGSVPAGTSFPITLTCGATVLNANATTATPAVFTRLPPGNCTVAEGTLPTIAGVTWGTPTYDPSATVTVTSGANAAVTVTNTASVTTYAITATPVPTAGGTVSCTPNPVDHGGTSTCAATANAGYTFANWSGDCTGSGACTLSNVTATKTVTAAFTLKTFTGPTATSTGNATATVTNGGDTCGFAPTPQFVGVSSVPVVPPAGYSFPHGLFDFTLANCPLGGTVTVTITYPSALPAGTVYWKYGPTPGNPSPTWYEMPANIAGNTATFSITDGGLGDDDLTANGGIVDQGGPGAPDAAGTADIPTLSEWAMLVLLSLLLGFSGWRLRRRGVL